MATNGKRNRTAGNNFERELVRAFSLFYPNVSTSRYVSRARDGEKVDLAHGDEIKHGRFPYNVQAKNYARPIAYAKLLAELPRVDGVINVVMHKQTSKINNRFMPLGKYAILEQDDFFKMVSYREGFKYLLTVLDEETKDKALLKLKELGIENS